MKRGIFIIGAIVLLLVPSTVMAERGRRHSWRGRNKEEVREHHRNQKKENRAFREGIKDLPASEKAQKIMDHRNAQFQENQAFHEKLHEERMAQLKERINKNDKLTDAQKDKILKFKEDQYNEINSLQQKQHDAHIAQIESLTQKEDLTSEELESALKDFRQTRKKESEGFRKSQRKKRRGLRQMFHPQDEPAPEEESEI